MLFTEPFFLFLFLPVLLGGYFVAPKLLRNPLLLTASLIFYAWGERRYTLVLLSSACLNYLAALAINRTREMKQRRRRLLLGIAGNLAVLVVFKYLTFLAVNLNRVISVLGLKPLPVPWMHLPIGISFFTFMGMSYLFDVYRQQIEPERRFQVFALYILLFPYLLAGPIVRYSAIARELIKRHFSRTELAEAIRRFIVGLGKKMLIANTLALTVDEIFKIPAGQLSPGVAWLGALV